MVYKKFGELTKEEIINYINKEDKLNENLENEAEKELLAEIDNEENDPNYTKNDDKILAYLENVDPDDGLV